MINREELCFWWETSISSATSCQTLVADGGLCDLTVEAGLIVEGSVRKVLVGRQYNRAVRLHQLTYKALMWFTWMGFQEWLKLHHPEDISKLNSTDVIPEGILNTCHEIHEAAISEDSCTAILDLFVIFLDILSKLWSSSYVLDDIH